LAKGVGQAMAHVACAEQPLRQPPSPRRG
jgi:hypothetical protein